MENKNNYIKTKGLLLSTIIVLLLCMNSNLYAATTADEINPKQNITAEAVRKENVLSGIHSASSLLQECYTARIGLVVLAIIVVLILFDKELKEASLGEQLQAILSLLYCALLFVPEGYAVITSGIVLGIVVPIFSAIHILKEQ